MKIAGGDALRSHDGLPVTRGRLLDFPDDPFACMRRLQQLHGNIAALEEEGQRLIFVFGPHYTQQVLSDSKTFHSRFFALRGPKNSAQRRLTSGLLTMNGEEHKRHRRMVFEPFQKKSIEKYRDALADLVQQMIGEWKAGQLRNTFRDMTHYMLRVTSSILFGFDLPDLAYTIGHMIEQWMGMNHELGMGAFISDPGITQGYSGLLEMAEKLEAQILAMIHHRRQSTNLGNDVLSLLIRARDESGTGMTDAELIGQAAILFGAAHLTTANTLTWTLFLLAQHPEIGSALFDELTGVLKGEVPTLDQLEQLPLLDRVIKESMRVLPASSYSQRINVMPVQVGPFHLSGATPIIFSPLISHRLPDQFPEPEHFLPERWLSIAPSPYAYFPFAAGPRMCLGATLAQMTLRITVPAIWQRFRLTVLHGAAIQAQVRSTMLFPTSGMPMLLSAPSSPFRSSTVNGNIHELVHLPQAVDAGTPLKRAA
ncbi:MAG TPA: cytochrome P450 [Gemmataceae bacterium]|nr:cytochrome P450 [Gemmataceae bacterium]